MRSIVGRLKLITLLKHTEFFWRFPKKISAVEFCINKKIKNKMIKKLKIGLLVAVLSLFVGVANSAFALTYNADVVITINGNNYTILSGSEATSILLDTTTLQVVTPASATFTLISSGRHTLTNNGSLTATCTNGESRLAITASLDVTVTPSTTACGAITSGGGGSGGGGYVATTSTTTTVPATPAVPAVQVAGCVAGQAFNTTTGKSCTVSATPAVPATPAIPGCGNRATGFSTATGVSCVGNSVTTPATPATPASASSSFATTGVYNFGATTLKNGSKGEPVKELQRFLNAKLNLGLKLDGKLGPKTIAVIKKWQKDNGLVADGLIGAKTKAKMNSQAQ